MKRPKKFKLPTNRRPIKPSTEALIASALLAQKQLFEDTPPKWREGSTNRLCQSAREAIDERLRLVKRLHRFGYTSDAASMLAVKLADCSEAGRCLSGACPECARAYQRLFVRTTARYLRSRGAMPIGSTILSPILREGIVKPGSSLEACGAFYFNRVVYGNARCGHCERELEKNVRPKLCRS